MAQPPSAEGPALQLQGLAYAHPGGELIRFADWQAAVGSTVRLHGPSGSGKSTLLALLAGLLTPTAGRVCVAGADVGAMAPRDRDAWRGATLGFVPQRLHLSGALSVWRNCELVYFAAGLPVDARRIGQVLDRLGLAALVARRPHALSLGQAQRVALARAVLRRPRLLLADEPTANLDDDSAADALALMADLAREQQATLVIASHDARVAAALPHALAWTLPPLP